MSMEQPAGDDGNKLTEGRNSVQSCENFIVDVKMEDADSEEERNPTSYGDEEPESEQGLDADLTERNTIVKTENFVIKQEPNEELLSVEPDLPPGMDDHAGTCAESGPFILPDYFSIEHPSAGPAFISVSNLQQSFGGNIVKFNVLSAKPKQASDPRSTVKQYGASRKLQAKSPQQQPKFHCSQCSLPFLHQEGLAAHVLTHQTTNQASTSSAIDSAARRTLKAPAPKFSCTFCNSRFSYKESYLAHLRTHDVSKDFYEASVQALHENGTTQPESFSCPFCNRMFTEKDELDRHCQAHQNKPYECVVCKATFLKESDYRSHLDSHTEERYFCKKCDKSFTEERLYQRHVKTHLPQNQRLNTCPACKVKFNTKAEFRTHIQESEKCKPVLVTCKDCNKVMHKWSLAKHRDRHSNLEYECDVCDKVYSTKVDLQHHLLRHKNPKKHKCGHCDKMFATRGNLVVHERTHTGETPFICSVCGKKYNRNDRLKEHMQKHLKRTEYICKVCSKSFTQKSFLTSHLFYQCTTPLPLDSAATSTSQGKTAGTSADEPKSSKEVRTYRPKSKAGDKATV